VTYVIICDCNVLWLYCTLLHAHVLYHNPCQCTTTTH